MAVGIPPFYNKDRDLLFKKILESEVFFPKFIGNQLKDLIENLLIKDPEKWMGCKSI